MPHACAPTPSPRQRVRRSLHGHQRGRGPEVRVHYQHLVWSYVHSAALRFACARVNLKSVDSGNRGNDLLTKLAALLFETDKFGEHRVVLVGFFDRIRALKTRLEISDSARNRHFA